MAAADAGGLHPSVGCQIGRSERQALHARRGAANGFDVGNATRCFENCMHKQWLLQASLCLELGEQAIDVMNVFGTLDLGDHDDIELVANFGDKRDEVVETPW